MNRRNGKQRATTADVLAPPASSPRAKRGTLPGIHVRWQTLLGVIAVAGFLAGGVAFTWRASTAFGDKADRAQVERKANRADVQELDKRLRNVETSVEVIKTEQRALGRALGVELGGDE